MGFSFRTSLSEDPLDRYTHTWTFLFVLFISLVSVFLPLSPSLTLTKPHPLEWPGQTPDTTGRTSLAYPKYTAICWTPPHFTEAYVRYTNVVCAAAVNALVQRRNITMASIHDIDDDGDEDINNNVTTTITTTTTTETRSETDRSKDETVDDKSRQKELQVMLEKLQIENESFYFGIQDLVWYITPLYLFVFAICLRIPLALWSIMSTFYSSFNVDQTLATTQAAQATDNTAWSQLRKDMVQMLEKSSFHGISVLFLVMKLLMVMALMVEIAAFNYVLLAETHGLEDSIVRAKMMEESMMRMDIRKEISKDSQNERDSSPHFPDYNGVYGCELEIVQLQNIQKFSIQCFFMLDTIDDKARERGKDASGSAEYRSGSGSTSGARTREKDVNPKTISRWDRERKVVSLYKTVFTLLMSMMIVLWFFNVVSFMAWLWILFIPRARVRLGLNVSSPIDLVFMVAMARRNTSVTVAMAIASDVSAPGETSAGRQSKKVRGPNVEDTGRLEESAQ